MKTTSLMMIAVSLFFLNFQNLQAQDCTGLFPMQENAEIEVTSYDKKGKKESISYYKVTELGSAGDVYEMTLDVASKDKKGKDIGTSTVTATCQDGNFSMDMSFMLPSAQMASMENMEMEMSGDKISFPADLSVGQTLPDAQMEMTASGPIKMSMNFSMINRKVVGEEKITVPAGSFDTYVITYDTKMKFMGNRTFANKLWLSPGIGLVKSESYDKKGKLNGYQELTMLKM